MTPPDRSDPAYRRYVLLTLLRGGGALMMIAGLVLWLGRAIDGGEPIGKFLFVIGAVESLVIPAILARQWRTPGR